MEHGDSSLIVAPHPDDETFAAGGLIASRIEQDAAVHVVFLTSGEASHQDCCAMNKSALQERREAECVKALEILGVPQHHASFLKLADGDLPHASEEGFLRATTCLSDLISQVQPTAVFVPHPLEGWSDHLAAEELTRHALAQSSRPAKLYHYCVWFWLSMPLRRALGVDWRNAVTFDISAVWEKKRMAMRTYLEDKAPCGVPYCGRLPADLLQAFNWNKELFFRVPGFDDRQGALHKTASEVQHV
jgi:LmbE family N-acetylglucosaminyl deacetylase